LANAAPHSQEIALGALLGLVIESLWIGIAVMAIDEAEANGIGPQP
jgi:hypothetical protein